MTLLKYAANNVSHVLLLNITVLYLLKVELNDNNF